MKKGRKYDHDRRVQKICDYAAVGSTILGETDIVKNNSTLRKVNTALGIGLNGCSLAYSIKQIDQFEDGDESAFIRYFARKLVIAPVVNSALLAYSLAPEERKQELRRKLGLSW